jgi:hypothetical protein
MTEIENRISNPETVALTREQVDFREQGGAPSRRCGECLYFEAGKCTRVTGISDVDGNDICSEYRHNLVDGSMSTQEAEVVLGMASLTQRHLFINRVSEDPQTGIRRWYSTSSGIKRDLYDERMSKGLFKDFVKRIEAREVPPEPFISKAWNGGLPYVGIAHYLDLDGDGIAGEATRVVVDGTHLKMRGTFEDNKLGNAAYDAIRRDIENKTPPDERVRVSIAFVDWGHEHEGIGQFVRKSLMDRCSYCEQGLGEKIYRKGHLVHLALTRQPAYPEADIQLEVKSMSRRKQDAASIVGDELAEDLEKKSETLTERSADIDPNAVVIRQDGEDVVEEEEDEEKKKKKGEEEEEEEDMVYESLAGAKSLDEADAFLTSRSKDVPLLDSWAIFASVLANIAGDEQREAVFRTVSEFQERLDIMALRALMKVSDMIEKAEAEVVEEEVADAPESNDDGGTDTVEEKSTTSHPLDEALSGLKDTFDAVMAETLPETERLDALQVPITELADVIKRSVSGEVSVDSSDILNSEVVKTAMQAVVAPLQAEIASMQAQLEVRSDVKPTKPVRRAITVNPATTVVSQKAPSKFTPIKDIVRRSVGIEEE